jgi:hypothetical protein
MKRKYLLFLIIILNLIILVGCNSTQQLDSEYLCDFSTTLGGEMINAHVRIFDKTDGNSEKIYSGYSHGGFTQKLKNGTYSVSADYSIQLSPNMYQTYGEHQEFVVDSNRVIIHLKLRKGGVVIF